MNIITAEMQYQSTFFIIPQVMVRLGKSWNVSLKWLNFELEVKHISTALNDTNIFLHTPYVTLTWFFNCGPTHLRTVQNDKEQKRIDRCKASPKAGLCSEERSMFSPDYARNFICDFIIGKAQKYTQLDLFENYGTTNTNDRGLLG